MTLAFLTLSLILVFVGVAGSVVYDISYDRAVKGSRQRYVAATARRLYAYMVVLGAFIALVSDLLSKEWVPAIIEVFVIAIWVWKLAAMKNDDDWFQKTGRKIKRGVKNFVASLQAGPQVATA